MITIDTDDLLARHEASLDRSVGQDPSAEIIQARRIRTRLLEERAVCRRQLAIHEEWGYDVIGNNSSSNSCSVETFQFRRARAMCTNTTVPTGTSHLKHHNKTSTITAKSHEERRRVVLSFAAALDGLDQRQNAIMLLESYLRNCHSHAFPTVQHDCHNGHDDDDDYDDDSNDTDDDSYNSNGYIQQQKKLHLDIPVTLALAKLYFKGNDKQNAMQLCLQILDHIRAQAHGSVTILDICDLDDAADAYHLAGWVYIHADDHTSAYRIWNEGALLMPSCQALNTQSKKRLCWDAQNPDEIDAVSESTDPLVFHSRDLAPALVSKCPALALFDPTTQKNQLVFATKHPILSPLECARVCQHVHDFHSQFRSGTWSTVRHASVPTTDVAVEDIPSLRPWLRNLLQYRLYPLLCTAFPKLARMKQETCTRRHDDDNDDDDDDYDTSTATTRNLTVDQLRVHDAFIVRYDAEHDMSLSLPEHSDTSLISFTVALNQRNKDFLGGGTWFESISTTTTTKGPSKSTSTSNSTREQWSDTANSHSLSDAPKDNDDDDDDTSIGGSVGGCVVDADQGHAVAFAGPLRHAGYPVTSGCRIILVLFLYAQDYAYGPLLEEYCKNNNDNNHNSERQTTTTTTGSRSPRNDKSHHVCCVVEPKTSADEEKLDDCIDCHNQENTAIRPSGDTPGGFVVYNQTVELVNMLNRQVASILDE
jgi:hypothetical protein